MVLVQRLHKLEPRISIIVCLTCTSLIPAVFTFSLLFLDRYFLVLEVTDNTASTKFELIGNQVKQIVGVLASQVWQEPNPNRYLLPPSLRALIGKRATFTVKFDLVSPRKGQKTFKVCKLDVVPPDVQLPAQEALRLPVHVTPLPQETGRDIAESPRHAARDKDKQESR